MSELARLNAEFGTDGLVHFEAGPGGLTVARVANELSEATVALHGAHVMAWKPAGGEEVLWLSRESIYRDGEPIRGGIPVCWPWFGAHPTNPDLPAHAFARRRAWTFAGVEKLDCGATRIRLTLADDAATRAMWPHAFQVELAVSVGSRLRVSLTMHNPGAQPYDCTAALHTYFGIGAVEQTLVHGLDGCAYVDTVNGANTDHVQAGAIGFDCEVDRVYVDTTAACVIEAGAQGRRIEVSKEGSTTTVVWNPWIAKSQRMPDFGDDEYHEMVCVETANARSGALTIPPGGSHTTTAILNVL